MRSHACVRSGPNPSSGIAFRSTPVEKARPSDKDAFIVGADITEFLGLFAKTDAELDQWLQFANSIFNKLEDLPVPTISVLKGHTLGGGCECVLATDM